jgi:hypothetical protein
MRSPTGTKGFYIGKRYKIPYRNFLGMSGDLSCSFTGKRCK